MWFLVVLTLAALMVLGAGLIFFPLLPSFFYQTLALLFMGTAGIYYYLVDVKTDKPKHFVQLYMATLFAKIIAYGGFMLFVVWDDPEQAGKNVLHFMVSYLFFTAIEIIFLYRKVTS